MAIVHWDPSREIAMLQGDMDRLFGRITGERRAADPASPGRWMPAMDITDADGQFVLHADLPGMAEDDLTIEVQERTLRIAGERRAERTGESGGFARRERAFGRFERQLTLPPGVDADAITASFERGVLELRIPKPTEASPRRIPISGASGMQGSHQQVEPAEADRPAKRSIKDRVLANA